MKKPNRTAKLGPFRVKPGETVNVICRHVSRSGMSRRLDFYLIRGGQAFYVTYAVSQVTGYKQSKVDSALVVGGCGMDMGFAVVYDLSRGLFPRGFYIGKTDYPRNGDKEIMETRIDPDGGYALTHRWI